jgi:hypothetical protein
MRAVEMEAATSGLVPRCAGSKFVDNLADLGDLYGVMRGVKSGRNRPGAMPERPDI